MLTGSQIRRYQRQPEREFSIEPFNDSQVQPASYDLTLGEEVLSYAPTSTRANPTRITDGRSEIGITFDISESTYTIHSGDFLLAHTRETVSLTDRVAGEVKGRSSIGRMGLIPHTAGWIDPGFTGQITLELVNHGNESIEITAGDPIAQIVFDKTNTQVSVDYSDKSDSKYQGQTGVTESRFGVQQPPFPSESNDS